MPTPRDQTTPYSAVSFFRTRAPGALSRITTFPTRTGSHDLLGWPSHLGVVVAELRPVVVDRGGLDLGSVFTLVWFQAAPHLSGWDPQR